MFTEVDMKRTFPSLEEGIEAWWRSHNIVSRVLESGDRSRPYVFFEGPPTANGRPGVHHVEARTAKDTIVRYHRMQGQHVIGARGGWDTHGLPVEIEVEKRLGFKAHNDYICAETLAESLSIGPTEEGNVTTEVELDGGVVGIGVHIV